MIYRGFLFCMQYNIFRRKEKDIFIQTTDSSIY